VIGDFARDERAKTEMASSLGVSERIDEILEISEMARKRREVRVVGEDGVGFCVKL